MKTKFPNIGDKAWFTKSMRAVIVIEDNKDGTYTVEAIDTGKTMIATKNGLKPF